MSDARQPITRQRSQWEPDLEVPAALEVLEAIGVPRVGVWRRRVSDGELAAMVADEPTGWHMSISHSRRGRGGTWGPGRYPTWDEIADARYTLLPADRDFVMHLPPPAEYVAVHETTFHLHEHPPR